MSEFRIHQYGYGRLSGNPNTNSATVQAIGPRGTPALDTRSRIPATIEGVQYNPYMGGQPFLDQYPPSPASFQASQDPSRWPRMHSRQGDQYGDIQYHQDPARFQNLQQGPSLSGQDDLVPSVTARTQGHPYPGFRQDPHHQAVRGFPTSRGPHSGGPWGHLQMTDTSTVQQGFTGQPTRQYTPQLPSHDLLQSSLGNPERELERDGTRRMPSHTPCSGNVARVQAIDLRSYPTNQAAQPGSGLDYGATYRRTGPFDPLFGLDGLYNPLKQNFT